MDQINSIHHLFHAHCYQKALSDKSISVKMMQIPKNYQVELIEDGCCGMAGSFGFEKEHYELSQKVGNLKLFPAIQNREENTIISACGTSCRHQIKDGTNEPSFHPIEILFNALIS
jgi:Fe-S oxidoreductase